MAAVLTLLNRSAIPVSTKVSTVSAQILRRIKRTSPAVPYPKIKKILKDYLDDLGAMGYSYEWRLRVLTSN